MSSKSEPGTLQDELAQLSTHDRNNSSQEVDEKTEKEECEDEKKNGKDVNEENKCRFPSPSFSLEVAEASWNEREAHHIDGPSGPEKKITPVITEGKEVKINIAQEDIIGDVKQDDNFHANDLLCFAWQIAEGMVSIVNNVIEDNSIF